MTFESYIKFITKPTNSLECTNECEFIKHVNTDNFLPFMSPSLWWPEQEHSSSIMFLGLFDVHRAVQPNIISIVKPTRSTNVSNLFYFGMTFYMFRTVFPSIIRSSRLYIQQYLFDKCLMLYVQS